MSTGPIAPLAVSDLDFAVVDYGFQALTADVVNESLQDEGLIDELLADFAQSIADQTVLIASMDSDLDDLSNVLNEIADGSDAAMIADLAAIAAAGDGMLSDLATTIG